VRKTLGYTPNAPDKPQVGHSSGSTGAISLMSREANVVG
jgi:hypothetical protein